MLRKMGLRGCSPTSHCSATLQPRKSCASHVIPESARMDCPIITVSTLTVPSPLNASLKTFSPFTLTLKYIVILPLIRHCQSVAKFEGDHAEGHP